MKKMLLVFCTMMLIAIGASAATPLRIGFPVKEKQDLIKSPKAIKMEERQALKASRAKAAKKTASVKSAASPITITLDTEFYVESYCSDDWYNYLFMLYGNDEEGNSYYIALDCYPPSKSWQATYSTEDFSLGGYYASAINNLTTNNSAWVADEEVSTFSVTKTSAEHYDITGTLYDEYGAVYTLSGTDLYYPDPQTYDMTGIKWTGYEYKGQYVSTMTTIDNAYFQLVFNVEGELQDGQTYTCADLDMNYSWGYWNEKYIFISECSFTKTTAPNGDDVISITIKDDNDNVYNIAYTTPKEPETYDDIYLTVNTAELYDLTASDGTWQFCGVSADGEWYLSIAGQGTNLVGQYTEEQLITDYTYIGLAKAEFGLSLNYCKIDNINVVEGPKAGDYICTADFYCYNGHCYHITFNHVCPDVANTINATSTNAKVNYYEPVEAYLLTASDDNYTYQMLLPELADTYAPGEAQIVILDNATDEPLDIYEDYGYTLQMEADGRVKSFKGSCITCQGDKFIFDLTYVLPTSTRTEDLVITEDEGELVPDGGTYSVKGNHDGREINLIVKSADIPGQYKIANVDALYSYYYEAGTLYNVEDANLNVEVETRDGNKQYATITGTLLCISKADANDRPLFNLTVTVPVKNGLKRDAFDSDFTATFASSDLSITDKAAEEGWILLQGKNADSQQIAMVFFVDAADAETVIPAGEYVINDTQSLGTVLASPGLDELGFSAQASFAGTTNALGFINEVWFLESGTVTVINKDGELAVQVNAFNSYNNKILVGINAETPDAIRAVFGQQTTGSRKALEHHQIVISKDSLRYNAKGQPIR